MKVLTLCFLSILLVTATVSTTEVYAQQAPEESTSFSRIFDTVLTFVIYFVVFSTFVLIPLALLLLKHIKPNYNNRPTARKRWQGFSGSSGGVPYGDGFRAFRDSNNDES